MRTWKVSEKDSFSMKCLVALAIVLVSSLALSPQEAPKLPKISGIGSVTIHIADHGAAVGFYSKQLGYRMDSGAVCAGAPHMCMGIDIDQRLDIVSPSRPGDGSGLDEIAFSAVDLKELRRYLDYHQIRSSNITEIPEDKTHYGLSHFSVVDPDGHRIGFVSYGGCVICEGDSDHSVSGHLIHAGFVVRDRDAEEHFYKDILGFRPYWHGGMKDGQTDWVSFQVPDGTDWVEFMVNVPTNADHRTLGAMNHIALGVSDIHAAEAQLRKNGWSGNEQPHIGRGGKWQLNVYDPDGTRIEFMEFKPVQKPCCSEYTGPHPGPQR
jgi:catechol 2,3-dioxygenase-like lactoylglutathione lyase family enzyme